MTRRHACITFALAAILLAAPAPHAAAQAGIPGSRLDTGRDHRAAAHAEAYLSAAACFDRWTSAWDARDANTLIKL